MKYIYVINLKIILAFSILILLSFIPEYFPEFFGDWTCQGTELLKENNKNEIIYTYVGCHYEGTLVHNPKTHWGYRHWLFSIMGLTLFILQIVNIVNYSNKK